MGFLEELKGSWKLFFFGMELLDDKKKENFCGHHRGPSFTFRSKKKKKLVETQCDSLMNRPKLTRVFLLGDPTKGDPRGDIQPTKPAQ